jgi:hypothetical protein
MGVEVCVLTFHFFIISLKIFIFHLLFFHFSFHVEKHLLVQVYHLLKMLIFHSRNLQYILRLSDIVMQGV